jgi:hypothetical protein
MLRRNLFIAVLLIVFTLLAMPLFAQTGELPAWYSTILSQEMLAAIAAVVAITKLVRNAVNVKGTLALVITVVVSFVYALIQYGFTGDGLIFSLSVGLFSTLSFYLTKNVGKVLTGEAATKTAVGKLSYLVTRK